MKSIMFHSYKGGSGKTLFALNLAKILSTDFEKKVLIIECDFRMPTYTNIFDSIVVDMYFNDYLGKQNKFQDYIYHDDTSNLDIIFAYPEFRIEDPVNTFNETWFRKSIQNLRNDLSNSSYDFIIFDNSPGYHLFNILTIGICDEIIIMVRPNNESIIGTNSLFTRIYNKLLSNNTKTTKNLRIILNQMPIGNESEKIALNKLEKINTNYHSFVKSIDVINYENESDYYIAQTDSLFLRANDPLFLKIKELIKKYFT